MNTNPDFMSFFGFSVLFLEVIRIYRALQEDFKKNAATEIDNHFFVNSTVEKILA